jgi:transcriptional regulator with XRE-family HTH domain
MTSGDHVRPRREAARHEPLHSVRRVAARVGIEPTYLSKIERGTEPPPSEEKTVAIARDLAEDPDVLLGLAGKVRFRAQTP